MSKNRAVIANAGSGKTTSIVDEVLVNPDEPTLVTTFTNENVAHIHSRFAERNGHAPKAVDIMSWYVFLLRHGVRPYQDTLVPGHRVESINFSEIPQGAKFAPASNPVGRFLSSDDRIFRDRVAEFVCQCDDRSGGRVLKRLERIYSRIHIDEFQDMGGYDLEIVERILRTNVRVHIVFDPRQTTYATNRSPKNQAYRGEGVMGWFRKLGPGLIQVTQITDCYRCNQDICDFADRLFPHLPSAISRNTEATNHDGVFSICRADVHDYVKTYTPVILRYDKRTDTLGLPAVNIGVMKGCTFDRVLIFPTTRWKEYLDSRDVSAAGDKERLYVALTRARFSAAFVLDRPHPNGPAKLFLHSAPEAVPKAKNRKDKI